MSQAGPSAHLSWSELACPDGNPYPVEWRLDRAIELAAAFERVRVLFGAPILISKGGAYRTRDYNARINNGKGGAKLSQHCEGRALDISPAKPGPRGLDALRRAVIETRREGLIRGVGFYRNFIHVDCRPGKAATWGGDRGIEGNVA